MRMLIGSLLALLAVCSDLDNEVGSGDGDVGLGGGAGPGLRHFHVYTDAFGNTVYDWRLYGALDYTGTTNGHRALTYSS